MVTGEIFYLGMLIGSIGSALIARSRGYSPMLYGGAGLLLNLGALPMVWYFTALPAALGQQQELGLNAPQRTQPASPRLAAWMAYYQGFRQAILLSSLSGVALMTLCLLGVGCQILPTFVVLYEGMSLSLPFPTLICMAIYRFLHGVPGLVAMWLVDLAAPWFLCRLLLSSYRLPLFGKVWRHADQIWLCLATGDDPSHLPEEVRRRLGPSPATPRALELERDYLQGALWTALLCFLPVLACFVLVLSFFIVGIYLPLSGGLVGNIGG